MTYKQKAAIKMRDKKRKLCKQKERAWARAQEKVILDYYNGNSYQVNPYLYKNLT